MLPADLRRERLLAQLDSSSSFPDDFKLCGSRRFGGVDETSDYDFFTLYSSITVNQLNELGFIKLDKYHAEYNDTDCICVMHHQYGIDIQLRHDPEHYERACQLVEILARRYELKVPTKNSPSRRAFWNAILLATRSN